MSKTFIELLSLSRPFLLSRISLSQTFRPCNTPVLQKLTQPIYYPTVRNYAKGKDKRKEKGKTNVQVNENQLAEHVNVDSLKEQMERSLTNLRNEYIQNLSLRSSVGAVESLTVNVDGTDHTLQELAQIVRKNPKTIVINMSVFPQAIPAAIKALKGSGMNLNPQQDGTTLFVPIQPVTKEHREGLAKGAKAMFVKCKDSIRDVQLKHAKTLKKKEGVSSDVLKSCESQIGALADKFIAEAEKVFTSKQQELLGKD